MILGPTELLILVFIGLLIVGVPLGIIAVVVLVAARRRSNHAPPPYPHFREEKDVSREELATRAGKDA